MKWRLFLVGCMGLFGCDIFEPCGPFPMHDIDFADSVTVGISYDSIYLILEVVTDYQKDIPITVKRGVLSSDSLKFVGQFDGEYNSDSLYRFTPLGYPPIEWKHDTLFLRFEYHSYPRTAIFPNDVQPKTSKGGVSEPLCSPPMDNTKLLSGTLFIPQDLKLTVLWPREVKLIE